MQCFQQKLLNLVCTVLLMVKYISLIAKVELLRRYRSAVTLLDDEWGTTHLSLL